MQRINKVLAGGTTIFILLGLLGCDSKRVYEKNNPISEIGWQKDSTEQFEITIEDKSLSYNVYFNLRESSTYPYYNIYTKYWLEDTLGNSLVSNLINETLYDPKNGKPLGQSGIGDVFDHQFELLKAYNFPYNGGYIIRFQHYMRVDTLQGIQAVGVRVERSGKEK